jgi:hypothetical protein
LKEAAAAADGRKRRILASLKEGKTVDKVPPPLMALYRPEVQPYLISSLQHDPRKAIAALKMPVLILQGTSDCRCRKTEAKAAGRSRAEGPAGDRRRHEPSAENGRRRRGLSKNPTAARTCRWRRN